MKRFRFSLLFQICVAHMVSHIHMLVLPVLMPIMLLSSNQINFVQIGLAISVFNIVSALAQTPVGIFVDRLGPKRVLLSGLILGSVTFLSLGLITHYIWLIIAMGIIGLANAVYHPADYAILSQCVREKRMGRAFSLHTFTGFAGAAVTPFLMLFAADLGGVTLAFIVSGVIGLVSAAILYPKAKEEIKEPIHIDGLNSDALKKSTDSSKIVETKKGNQSLNRSTGFKYQLNISAILLMLILFLLLSLGTGSIQNFSVSALVTGYGISLADANVALTAFLICSAIGVLVGGQMADYTNKHGLIAAVALIITALLALILAILSIYSAILITIIVGMMGFLSGLIAPSRDMLVRNISPRGAEGRFFGIVSTGYNIGGAIGPLLFGYILDHGLPRGIFWSAVIFLSFTALIAIYQERKGSQ
ncbi:MFS transporter [Orbaceae bacterium ESL0721]|nr:MFS transporter [Orbaceae bacterium ESL0721]